MPKITINDKVGIKEEIGSGVNFISNVTLQGDHASLAATFCGGDTTTAAADAVELDHRFVQLVDSANNAHKVKMPSAKGAGQLMIIVNVDAGQDFVLRNNADDANILAGSGGALGEGKIALCVSTASGDNWSGSRLT